MLGLTPERDNLRELNKLKDTAKAARQPFDADYWTNLAFYLGAQYSAWDVRAGTLAQLKRQAGEESAPRPVANKILHFTVKSHAEALAHDPRPEVLAPTADAADRSEARVAQAYLTDLLLPVKADWPSVRSEGLSWAVVAGQAWFKWVYDADLKRPSIEACSPFEIYCDPYVKRADLARYIVHAQFLDREQVYDRYGVEVPEGAMEQRDPAKALVMSSLGYEPKISGVTVNELWMRPCRRYPKGRFVAWTGSGKLLTPIDGAFPYEHGMLPFTQIGVVPVPGNMNHHAFTKFLRPPQMELNAVHAQMLVSRKAFGSPKVFMDSEMAQSLVSPWSDQPNQVLVGDTQGGQIPAPVFIQPSLMADNGTAEWVTSEMRDIVGQHDVSTGEAPGRVDSARALELLKAEDQSHLAYLRGTMETAVARGCNMLLQLARQYVPEATIVSTYTRLGAPEVHKFKGSKITPEHIVRVTSQAAVPQSKAAREEQVMAWWTAQIITDPRQMQELLELPFSPGAYMEQDVLAATNENFAMLDEVAKTPNTWDDHDTHIREHNAGRKSAEFAASSNGVHDRFAMHIQAHEQMWLEEMRQEADKQATIATFGQPPAPDPALNPTAPPAPVPPGA